MLYEIELVTKAIPVPQFFEEYYRPETFLPLCEKCPDYGRAWSCPPEPPDTTPFRGFKDAVILGVKDKYTEEARSRALRSPEETEAVRAESYGTVKRRVIEIIFS